VKLRVELLRERLDHLSCSGHLRILEVGLGSGDVTLLLARRFSDVTCIEPDQRTCELVLTRLETEHLGPVKLIRSPIEEAEFGQEGYHHIVMSGTLEHLKDPVTVLRRVIPHLQAGGVIHVLVNLAGSLHRRLGVTMGLISRVEELSESDVRLGHYRVYTIAELREHLKLGGLRVTHEQPFYLKPLPTSLLTPLPMEIHQGLDLLGRQFPEFASYVYVEAVAEWGSRSALNNGNDSSTG